MRLKNKIAVVIGSSRGLGLSIAKGYKAEGARVIITYLNKKQEATARYKEFIAKILFFPGSEI